MVAPRAEIVGLFGRLAAVLDGAAPEHAFIGAMARNAWGRPRTTSDLDLEMALDTERLLALEAALAEMGVTRAGEVGPEQHGDEVPDNLIYRSEDGIRVDVLVTKTAFQRRALERRQRVTVFGHVAWVVAPEDLVVYKLIAGRPRDLDDIEDVLETRTAAGLSIDWDYLVEWADAWSVAPRLAPLLARFRP